MKDKDLADRVVALGVVEAIDGFYYFRDKLFDRTAALTATQTARDPRVAMALMERCWSVNWKRQNTPAGYVVMAWSHTDASRHSRLLGDSLPRAIIEAAVLALEAK